MDPVFMKAAHSMQDAELQGSSGGSVSLRLSQGVRGGLGDTGPWDLTDGGGDLLKP